MLNALSSLSWTNSDDSGKLAKAAVKASLARYRKESFLGENLWAVNPSDSLQIAMKKCRKVS